MSSGFTPFSTTASPPDATTIATYAPKALADLNTVVQGAQTAAGTPSGGNVPIEVVQSPAQISLWQDLGALGLYSTDPNSDANIAVWFGQTGHTTDVATLQAAASRLTASISALQGNAAPTFTNPVTSQGGLSPVATNPYQVAQRTGASVAQSVAGASTLPRLPPVGATSPAPASTVTPATPASAAPTPAAQAAAAAVLALPSPFQAPPKPAPPSAPATAADQAAPIVAAGGLGILGLWAMARYL